MSIRPAALRSTSLSRLARLPLAVALTVGLGLAVLSAGVKVRSQYDKTFAFKGLKTWAWHPDGAGDVRMALTADDNPASVKEKVDPVIQDAVQQGLTARGFEKAPAGAVPQVYVTYYVLINTSQSRQTMGQFVPTVPEWGIPPFSYGATQSLKVFPEGTLILDLTEAKARNIVWRAAAQAELQFKRQPAEREAALRAAIADMLKKLPKTS
jgi:hypothetical protein